MTNLHTTPTSISLPTMSHMGSDILRLPPQACSAESAEKGGPRAASAAGARSNSTGIPGCVDVQSELGELGELASLTSGNALGDEFAAFGPHKTRSVRNFWSVHEDSFLLSVVIDNRDLLLIPSKSRPRSRFWHHISDELRQLHGFERNKRQCRDRFNLLYWKAVRNKKPETDDTRELDRLLLQCLKLFYIDKNNSIMLRDHVDRDQSGAAAAAAAAVPTPVSSAAAAAGLSQPHHSPRSETDDSPSSSNSYYPDMTTDSLADMAYFLQRQVYTLNRKVDELCGVLAMQRSRLDFLASAKATPDSPVMPYPGVAAVTPHVTQQQQQQQMLQHAPHVQHPRLGLGVMYPTPTMASVPAPQPISAQQQSFHTLESLSAGYLNDNFHHAVPENQ